MTRRRAYALVAAIAIVPRVLIAAHERGALFVDPEKSDILARVFLKTGTFGYIPGKPSAYTQPLYGWFLIVVYWILGHHWWSFSSVQIVIAGITAILVYEIGRQNLSARIGVLGAAISTLQPYLVWHDLHANREILDQVIGAAMFALVLAAGRSARLAPAAWLGVATGLGILSNARLAALPVLFALFLLWRRAGWIAALAVPILAIVVISPWVIRNKVEVGCFAITTDGRALWKANNADTYRTLRSGLWIDDVTDDSAHDSPQRAQNPRPLAWYTPQEAGVLYDQTGVKAPINECTQERVYTHLAEKWVEHHPGGKAKLMVQATQMMWDPRVLVDNGDGSGGNATLRLFAEPIWVSILYALALAGLFAVPYIFRLMAIGFAVYETLAAWVFAGTTRYRVPWDFVLALLAAAALERWVIPRLSRLSPLKRRTSSQYS